MTVSINKKKLELSSQFKLLVLPGLISQFVSHTSSLSSQQLVISFSLSFYLPVTAAVCPLSVQVTDGGDGTRTQTDSVPSAELHPKRNLSSLANLIAVTKNKQMYFIKK